MAAELATPVALGTAVREIAARVAALRPPRPAWARLVGVSGIDGSGKGTFSAGLAAALEERGHRVAVIGLDDWHEPAAVRFGEPPGEHFYRHAFDLERLFSRVIEPLCAHRALRHEEVRPHPHTGVPWRVAYDFFDVDVVVFEGVFLFRRGLTARYDLRVWVDCPWDVALERAVRRDQEGLPAARIRADYRRIYFPAQQHHLAVDRPIDAADFVVANR